jgi:hypothetical protein
VHAIYLFEIFEGRGILEHGGVSTTIALILDVRETVL